MELLKKEKNLDQHIDGEIRELHDMVKEAVHVGLSVVFGLPEVEFHSRI